MHIWEAWIGQKIVRCESLDDGRFVLIRLEDGRGAYFKEPHGYHKAVQANCPPPAPQLAQEEHR